MAALVIIVALLMPMAAIIAVFSGTLELDVAALQEQIAEEMSDSAPQMLQQRRVIVHLSRAAMTLTL